MIFKQVQEIISGQKTQTRRLIKPGDYTWICGCREDGRAWYSSIHFESHRVRFERGKSYAVQARRGGRGLWVHPDAPGYTEHIIRNAEDYARGWRPLRIEITALWREHVQDMTLADCEAEGIASYTFARGVLSETPPDPRWKYIELWDSINTRKGTRWSDNPEVWVIEFKVVTP